MAKKKIPDDEIKKSFEQLNAKAPKGMWDDISSSLSNEPTDTSPSDHQDFYKKIKDSYASIRESAPSHIWDNIRKSLDIDKAWAGISYELDKKPVIWRYRKLAASLLLLLFSVAGYMVIDNLSGDTPDISEQKEINYSNTNKSSDIVDEIENSNLDKERKSTGEIGVFDAYTPKQLEEEAENEVLNNNTFAQSGLNKNQPSAALSNNNLKDNATEAFTENKKSTLNDKRSEEFTVIKAASDLAKFDKLSQNNFAKAKNETAFPGSRNPDMTENLLNRHSSLNYLEPLSIQKNHLPAQLEIIEIPNNEIIADEKNKRQDKRFEIGVFYSYDNTWFLSYETDRSLEKGSLYSTKRTFVHNYGLSFLYNLSLKNAISLEFQNSSKAEQDYYSFKEGQYVDEGLHLGYTKFTMLYNQRFMLKSHLPMNWMVAVGGYYAILNNSHSHRDGYDENLPYSNNDIGIKLSVGQEFNLERFRIGFGIKAERGLKNIYTGTDVLPAESNKTYNSNLGFFLNVNYSIGNNK